MRKYPAREHLYADVHVGKGNLFQSGVYKANKFSFNNLTKWILGLISAGIEAH